MDVCDTDVLSIDLLPDWLKTGRILQSDVLLYPVFQRSCFIQTFYNTENFVGCWVMAFIMLTIGLGVFKKTQGITSFCMYLGEKIMSRRIYC